MQDPSTGVLGDKGEAFLTPSIIYHSKFYIYHLGHEGLRLALLAKGGRKARIAASLSWRNVLC